MNRTQQVAREIVSYVQANLSNTRGCIDFIEYELKLRFVEKDTLAELAKMTEPDEATK